METQTVFDVKEAAIYLYCSISSIRKLVKGNQIPYYKIGNRILFRKEALSRWMEEQEKSAYNRG